MKSIDVGIDRQTIDPDVTAVMTALVCRSTAITTVFLT